MDKMDRKILEHMQGDSSLSHAEIGERVHLSASQVSRRIQRMQNEGIIAGQVTLLDEQKLGLQVEAYVAVSLSSYSPDVVRKFHERMTMLDEVLSCASTTGDLDYLLRIVARDLRAYSRLMNTELLGHGDVASVRTSVVLDRIKHTTALPIPD
ncbi:Lrp/AsnC family transcriptional regulator [Blastomonas fulva]|jgi:Lrp/AsnC family leucine-responsive transcriptional regulator|uniref:Lrp/AsnC family transcriptional regulator n=1 Tax=Blastomonas fulva TaxID=1550728 RepID=UPI003D2A9717